MKPMLQRSGRLLNDDELMRLVKDELRRYPDVDAAAIAVAGSDGRVTLRGTVGSDREKRAAGRAGANVFGVVALDNALEVARPNAQRREDTELRAGVLEALMLDTAVPESVDVKVEDGFVTLTGTAKWQYQREAAEVAAGSIVGARHVNKIQFVQPTSPDVSEVKERMARALGGKGAAESDQLRISASAGKVTITGTVRSWSQHDDAIAAAWAIPGVTELKDRIAVAP
jgi:osmotically-inducible protein OsmY